MNYHITELNRFLKDKSDKFDKNVIEYGISFVNRIIETDILKTYFDDNSISMYTFLNELLYYTQTKSNIDNSDINTVLTEPELNQVIGNIIIKNEILKLILKDEISIVGLNIYDQFIYYLSDDAVSYFKNKYNINLQKTFSMNDILVISTDTINFLKE